MNIARHITDLLFLHECVIVPGLGGFISSAVPARIDTEIHEFFPPSVQIAFNAGLTTNDGMLANHIATVENTTFREALFEIKNWVDDCRKKINAGNRFEIEGLGILFCNQASNVEFEPHDFLNFSSDAFGLPVFRAAPVGTTVAIGDLGKLHRVSPLHRIIPETLKWAAVLAPFAAFALWGTFNGKTIGNYVHNYTGMYSWVRSTPGKTIPGHIISYTETAKPAKVVAVTSPATIFKNNAVVVSAAALSHNSLTEHKISIIAPATGQIDETSIESTSVENYHIIGGAFREYNNALRLIAQLQAKGYPAAIVDTTAQGLYVVSLSGFTTSAEALEKLREIRHNGFSSAWILKKPKS